MEIFLVLVGLLAILIGLVMLGRGLVKNKNKKNGIVISLTGLVLIIIAIVITPVSGEGALVTGEGNVKAESEEETSEDESNDADIAAEKLEEKKKKAEEAILLEKTKNVELFSNMLPLITEDSLTLDPTSYDFIVNNDKLFPSMSESAVNQAKKKVDSSITIKHLNKNATPYFETMFSASGTVISVEEETLDDGQVYSITHILDNEYNSYMVAMLKSTGDILEDDYIQFWGVPVGAYSFSNISGGSTNAQMFFGSHIQKQ